MRMFVVLLGMLQISLVSLLKILLSFWILDLEKRIA